MNSFERSTQKANLHEIWNFLTYELQLHTHILRPSQIVDHTLHSLLHCMYLLRQWFLPKTVLLLVEDILSQLEFKSYGSKLPLFQNNYATIMLSQQI